ncbi:hypothetical protein SAMN05216480_101240 [Pustulibacterium marinum]|uniref:Uncharacterized protein n=1 Tax=Pustulibacterium marinum TaxID=1224947 RepID=A0A1I7EUN5_9FLAO|nr:hypothetical protein [Pustulibacterium marinum]SFU27620.1 hypothetical protein SAMN05216480_101240 [Pustulibacterium marinum]
MKLTVRILSLFILLLNGYGQAYAFADQGELDDTSVQEITSGVADSFIISDNTTDALFKSNATSFNLNDKTEITESEEQEEDLLHFHGKDVKTHNFFISSFFLQLSVFTYARVKQTPLGYHTSFNVLPHTPLYISNCVYRL